MKPKRSNYCAAFWCNNCTGVRLDARISFFSFPKEEWRAKKWLKFTLREDLVGLDLVEIKNLRLCSDHFEENCFRKKYPKPLLSHDAVPSLQCATSKINAHTNDHDDTIPDDAGGIERSETRDAVESKKGAVTYDHDSTRDSAGIEIGKTASGKTDTRKKDHHDSTLDSSNIDMSKSQEDLGNYCWI